MKTPIEEWRPIAGSAGYEVSDLGTVRSWKKYGSLPIPHLLTTRDHDGYTAVQLSNRRALVHRLVLATFVGPRPDGLLSRHLDGDRGNNTLANLVYGTASENMQDRVLHGNDPQSNRTHCPQGHEYTPENTTNPSRWRGGPTYRQCRTCRSATRRQNYLRTIAKKAPQSANGGAA